MILLSYYRNGLEKQWYYRNSFTIKNINPVSDYQRQV